MKKPSVDFQQLSEDYQQVELAIRFLEHNFRQQPGLAEIASQVHLSEYHFQRLFKRWVGISPKRYLQYLTKEYARKVLARSNLLETAFASGLSGPGRLHDLFVTWEAVTPGEYRRMGEGVTINYGVQPTPFGECLLALTGRGICHLAFIDEIIHVEPLIAQLKHRWRKALLVHDEQKTIPYFNKIFAPYLGEATQPLNLEVIGTSFQLKVWEALLRIPPGSLVTYHDISVFIGLPSASRAVGRAISQNPIPVLIPCHRVIRSSGEFSGYRWGSSRKKAILGWEMSTTSLNS
jgi:AraC family transcriptional regulator of adaptative response/methylated-DNA-[protein]-cysteine methyltransferase